MSYKTLLAIGIGGFFGANLRYYFSTLNNELFPLDTLFVNILGSFLLGLLYAYFKIASNFPSELKSLISTGFLGGLTTYATFSYEALMLLKSTPLLGLTYLFITPLFSIAAAGVGFMLLERRYQ